MQQLFTYLFLFGFVSLASAQNTTSNTLQVLQAESDRLAISDTVVINADTIDTESEANIEDLDYPYLDGLTDSVNNDMRILAADSAYNEVHILKVDSTVLTGTGTIATSRWMPDPKKAMWLAIVFPGGGQIYNRKYWKLPLIYGGFIGCIYALSWNGSMYRDYSQAYMDIMDNDPNTKSYENFLPASYDVNSRLDYLQNLFKRKKNYFRRYRDLSLFAMIGVYLLSIVDAYVDAELSSFDISRDLTMKIRPTIFNGNANKGYTNMAGGINRNDMNGNSYGLQCRLSF